MSKMKTAPAPGWYKVIITMVIIVAALLIIENRASSAGTPRALPAHPVGTSTAAAEYDDREPTLEIQTMFKSFGYTIAVDGIYGPQTTGVVKHWQNANGLQVDGIAGPITRSSLGLGEGAVVIDYGGVSELDPVPPAATGPSGLSGCALMKWHRQNVGLPEVFDQLVWRESRCRAEPGVSTYCCYGPLQLYFSLHYRDHRLKPRMQACGVYQISDMNGPDDLSRHYCYAKAVLDVQGIGAWSL